jgi:hypothetical protein
MEIPKKQLLPFIDNEKLYRIVFCVLMSEKNPAGEYTKIDSNVVDPFSAVFDALKQGITLKEWLRQEEARQKQKTLQNALGVFHQAIIGSINGGWENIPVGHVIDVCNKMKKIIAEIKNKFNTTKGSDKKTIYDNLNSQLKTPYNGFTGYYVEIIPRRRGLYNLPFTPSDNVLKNTRPVNQKIRVIDGKSFYALATGIPDALEMLYKILPRVIADFLKTDPGIVCKDQLFNDLFTRAY